MIKKTNDLEHIDHLQLKKKILIDFGVNYIQPTLS